MAKVFISYSRKDIDFAKRLTTELQKSDLDFWIDWEGIPPTVDWWREIEKGIEDSDAFLFLISPDSAKSKICGQEIDTAVKNGKRIIPIVVREIEWQDTPPQLGHLNYIFFSRDDDFNTAIKKLISAIQTDYEWIATHRRLQAKALEWERAFKENSFLLRGKDLKEADSQLRTDTTKDPQPTDLQHEYVLKSHKAVNRQRGVTVFALIVMIIITTLAGTAIYQLSQINILKQTITAMDNAQEAQTLSKLAFSQHLALISNLVISGVDADQTAAVLLANYSMQISPRDDARVILRNYLTQNSTQIPNSDEELIFGACNLLPRNLTLAEWKQYVGDASSYQAICENLPIESEATATP